MAPTKTTSATIYIKGSNLTYIFLNQPTTNFINWIRFKDPKNPEHGKIDGINAAEGPISAYLYDDISIRLFFTGKNPEASAFKDYNSIQEIQLPGADKETTNVTSGWQNASVAKVLTFENQVDEQVRLSDASSFLSLTLGSDGGTLLPAAVWKTASSGDNFLYGCRKKDGTWDTTKFQFKK